MMSYDECVQFISSAEAVDTEQKSVIADVYDMGANIEITEYEDKQTDGIVQYVDDATGAQSQQQGAGQGVASKYNVTIPSAAAGASAMKKEGEAIAKEIGGLLSKTGSEFSKYTKKPQQKPAANQAQPQPPKPAQKLVLVTLSFQDQISELEKINTLLDQGKFTTDQIQIVRLEISGLMKNRGTPADDFQKGLVSIRDARLEELAVKLGL